MVSLVNQQRSAWAFNFLSKGLLKFVPFAASEGQTVLELSLLDSIVEVFVQALLERGCLGQHFVKLFQLLNWFSKLCHNIGASLVLLTLL